MAPPVRSATSRQPDGRPSGPAPRARRRSAGSPPASRRRQLVPERLHHEPVPVEQDDLLGVASCVARVFELAEVPPDGGLGAEQRLGDGSVTVREPGSLQFGALGLDLLGSRVVGSAVVGPEECIHLCVALPVGFGLLTPQQFQTLAGCQVVGCHPVHCGLSPPGCGARRSSPPPTATPSRGAAPLAPSADATTYAEPATPGSPRPRIWRPKEERPLELVAAEHRKSYCSSTGEDVRHPRLPEVIEVVDLREELPQRVVSDCCRFASAQIARLVLRLL